MEKNIKLMIRLVFLLLIGILTVSCGGSSVTGTDQTGGNGTATLTWSAPIENTDGSALTDLNSYNLFFGSQKAYTDLANPDDYVLARISINHEDGSNDDENLTCEPGEKRNINNDPEVMTCTIHVDDTTNWFFAVEAVNELGISSAHSGVKCKTFTSTDCNILIPLIESAL